MNLIQKDTGNIGVEMLKRSREVSLEESFSNCNLIDVDELNFGQLDLEDKDEYEVLKKNLNFSAGISQLSYCEKKVILKEAVYRYHRYLDGISDWTDYEYIYDDIKSFLMLHYDKCTNIQKAMLLMRSIDKALFLVATKTRTEFEHQTTKLKT